jgi:hypothetical protein
VNRTLGKEQDVWHTLNQGHACGLPAPSETQVWRGRPFSIAANGLEEIPGQISATREAKQATKKTQLDGTKTMEEYR